MNIYIHKIGVSIPIALMIFDGVVMYSVENQSDHESPMKACNSGSESASSSAALLESPEIPVSHSPAPSRARLLKVRWLPASNTPMGFLLKFDRLKSPLSFQLFFLLRPSESDYIVSFCMFLLFFLLELRQGGCNDAAILLAPKCDRLDVNSVSLVLLELITFVGQVASRDFNTGHHARWVWGQKHRISVLIGLLQGIRRVQVPIFSVFVGRYGDVSLGCVFVDQVASSMISFKGFCDGDVLRYLLGVAERMLCEFLQFLQAIVLPFQHGDIDRDISVVPSFLALFHDKKASLIE